MKIKEVHNDDIAFAFLLPLLSLMTFGFDQQPNPIIINIYTDKKVEIKNDEQSNATNNDVKEHKKS